MVVVQLANTAEGGSNGVTVSAANSGSGSGSAWTAVTIGSGADLTFSNAQAAAGSLSYRIATGLSAAQVFTTWDSTVVGSPTRVYGRAYIYLTATSQARELVRWRRGTTQVARLRYAAGAGLELRQGNNSATAGGTGTTVLATGAWYRVEWDIQAGTLTNTVTLYAGHSTTPLETISGAGVFATTGVIDEVCFGQFTAAGSLADLHLDELVVNDTGLPGPALRTVAGGRATSGQQARAGAGLKSAAGGRPAETDTARSGTGAKTGLGGRAVTTEAARPGTGLKTTTAGGRAAEHAEARPGAAAKSCAGGRAVEHQTARAGAGLVTTAAGGRAVEHQLPRSGAGLRQTSAGRAVDHHVARAGTGTKTAAAGRAASTEIARAGSTLIAATGRAVEHSTAPAGAGRTTVPAGRAVEHSTARAGAGVRRAAGVRAVEHDRAIVGLRRGPVRGSWSTRSTTAGVQAGSTTAGVSIR